MIPKATEPFSLEAATPAPNLVDTHVGARVRVLRLLQGMKQNAFAEMVGVTVPEMQQYEFGERRIPEEHLDRICGALNVPASFFFNRGSVLAGEQ